MQGLVLQQLRRSFRNSAVEEGEPEAITDGVYQIRTRHTGKYLYHDSVTSGGYLVHNYYHGDSEVQDYWIERYNDTEYFTISPEESRELYFTVSSVADGSGGTRIQLQSGQITDAKLFRFQYNTTLNAWQIISKANENRCIEVSLTYTNPYYYGVSNTNISGLNQGFILERLSDMITSSATYSWGGEVLESVTDSRGNTTTYEYDDHTFLLLGVTDAKGTVTTYTYDPNNDRIEEVQTAGSVVIYQYETDGAIKNIITPSDTTYQFVYDDFGRTTQIKVGNTVLSETQYKDVYSSLVSRMTYGNDDYRTYEYDDLDRLISEGINESTTRTYLYDKQSNLVQVQDFLANVTTKFQYDLIGRTVGINMSDGQSLRMIYDNYNRVSLLKWSLGEESFSTGYIYGDNTVAGQKTSLLYGVTLNGEQKIGYTYDELTRLESKTLATEAPFVTEYGYLEGSTAGTTTTLVKTVKNGNTTLEYAYDAVGNITNVKKNGVVIESYTYDALNQLTGATYGGNTYTYAYDNGGNITEVKKNGTVIKSYTYGNASWKDQLTAFNGETITYDKIGNPLTYRNNLSFTWQNGRQLSSIMQSGNLLASYTYNADGLRTSKTVGGATTEYYWMNGTLYAQKTGEEYIYFLYDESGIAYGFVVKNNTENAYYYYEFNLQGDIIGIVNSAGTKVVEYTYGAWGDILSITGSMATTIGQKNPLRYRGYYYDGETGFYYVMNRYYDAEVSRWLNADGQISGVGGDVSGYNQFAYCFNNPINMDDPTGNWPKWMKGVKKAVAAVAAATAVVATAAVLIAAAPAAICTITTVGIYMGLSSAAITTVTTVATVAAAATTVAAAAYAGDTMYASITGESILLDTVFGGDTEAYNRVLEITNIATAGMLELARLSPGVCFVAGTLVLTSYGQASIEDIEVGDMVWAENPETGEKELKAVVQTFVNETDELVHVYVNGEEIITTPEHPFYVPTKGWVSSIDLRAGDILVLQSGEYVIVEMIQHEILESPITVYNFEVEDFHTYYVGASNILVHNMCAKKSDIKQIEDVARKMGMTPEERRGFGDYVEFYKKGKRNDANFTYKELVEIAEEYMGQ